MSKLSDQLRSSQVILLSPGEYNQREIYSAVQAKYPNLCSDHVLCPHDPNPHRPEWQHNVRSVLQSLKQAGKLLNPSRNRWILVSNETISTSLEIIKSLKLEESRSEGERKLRYSNYYERDPLLRAAAITIHGTRCMACGFDFGEKYGEHGVGFIEVHHLKPLGLEKSRHDVDPKRDMAVVCPNCHRMIHRKRDRVLSIKELRDLTNN